LVFELIFSKKDDQLYGQGWSYLATSMPANYAVIQNYRYTTPFI